MPQMRMFGRARPQSVVVKEYGRDSFLGLINPVMTLLILSGRNVNARRDYQARLIDKMEADARDMARRGYRVASTREYERPNLGISYYRVTYELADQPR